MIGGGDYFLACYRELLKKGLSEDEAFKEVWGDLYEERDYDYGLDSRYN